MPNQPQAPLRDRHAAVVDHVLNRLRADGHRITTPRRLIIGALARIDAHPTVEQISTEIETSAPGMHLSTIYRTLETLADLGVVTHVHLGHGTTAYHLTTAASRQNHVHAECQACGRVIDFPPDVMNPVRRKLDDLAGFTLHPHHVALSGTCQDCSSA